MDPAAAAERNLLLKAVTGSRAYGTSMPGSDVDIRGVFAADPISVMTPFYKVGEVAEKIGDTKIFELSKFVSMICDQNPNIVELLWLEPSDVISEAPEWALLKGIRADLLSRHAFRTYGGYAADAIRTFRNREGWSENPQPEEQPRPAAYLQVAYDIGLDPALGGSLPMQGRWTAIAAGKDAFALFEGGSGSWSDKAGNLRILKPAAAPPRPPVALLRFDRDAYERAKRDHASYWTWVRNRDPGRDVVGYDVKNAYHLLRLLRTGREILSERLVRVRRPDANELLSIRRGEWSLERVLAAADSAENALQEAYRTSTLPDEVDRALVGDAVVEMYKRTWAASNLTPARRLPPRPSRTAGAPDLRGCVVVVDLEFTGWTDPGDYRVVEMGAVEIAGGRLTGRTFHSYVDPKTGVNPHAEAKHGLTRAFLAGKPAFPEAVVRLLDFIGDAPVMAHNAISDVNMLSHDLRLAGMRPLGDLNVACTERLARTLFGTSLGVDTLCDALGVDRGPRGRAHGALLDATLLALCALRMADMPGYATAARVWLAGDLTSTARERRERRKSWTSVSPDRCVDARIDAGLAVFTLADGRELAHDLPPMPQGYGAEVLPSLAIAIFRPDGRVGRKQPENPDGPALLAVRGGEVTAFHFEDGRPARRPPDNIASPRH